MNSEDREYANQLTEALMARDGFVTSAGPAQHVGDLPLDEDEADVLMQALVLFTDANATAEDQTDRETAMVLRTRLDLL